MKKAISCFGIGYLIYCVLLLKGVHTMYHRQCLLQEGKVVKKKSKLFKIAGILPLVPYPLSYLLFWIFLLAVLAAHFVR